MDAHLHRLIHRAFRICASLCTDRFLCVEGGWPIFGRLGSVDTILEDDTNALQWMCCALLCRGSDSGCRIRNLVITLIRVVYVSALSHSQLKRHKLFPRKSAWRYRRCLTIFYCTGCSIGPSHHGSHWRYLWKRRLRLPFYNDLRTPTLCALPSKSTIQIHPTSTRLIHDE